MTTYLTYEERMKEGKRIKLEHRTALETEYSMTGHPKAEQLYQLAWDYGHSSGLHEVGYFYGELIQLVDRN